jgi:hypothetical protein
MARGEGGPMARGEGGTMTRGRETGRWGGRQDDELRSDRMTRERTHGDTAVADNYSPNTPGGLEESPLLNCYY